MRNSEFLEIYLLEKASESLCAVNVISKITKSPSSGKCLLIDRDGTLIEHIPYLINFSDVKFIAETVAIIQFANSFSVPVYVVSNQAGVAHGFFTEGELENLNFEISNHLYEHYNVTIDGILCCVSHPIPKNGKIAKICKCRKPDSGLLLEALSQSGTDTSHAGMLGDSDSDIAAAINAGLKYYWKMSDTNRAQIKQNIIKWLSGKMEP